MEKQLIPQLRFSEFSGEWERIKLGESIDLLTDYHANGSYEKLKQNVELLNEDNYALMIRTTNFENRDFKTQAKYINQSAYNYLKKSKVYCDDIIINKIANAGATYLMPELNRPVSLAMNLFLLRIKNSSSSRYVYYQLKVKEYFLKNLASGTGTKTITKDDVRSFKINIPQLSEQQKIASFLTDVDDKIKKLNKKKSLLVQYKKGVMQKIFNQELRFKDDEGNDFSDWEEKKLGEVAKFLKGKGLPKSEIVENAEYKCIHYGELFTKYDELINKVISRTNNNVKMILSIENDVLMPTSDVTPNGLATASCLKESNVILGGDVLIIRQNLKVIEGVYLAYYIKHFRKDVMKLVSGSTVYHLYGSDMKNLKIKIPCLKEQTKIANFLSEIDLKIEVLNTKIENSKSFKKGLLQQLFV